MLQTRKPAPSALSREALEDYGQTEALRWAIVPANRISAGSKTDTRYVSPVGASVRARPGAPEGLRSSDGRDERHDLPDSDSTEKR